MSKNYQKKLLRKNIHNRGFIIKDLSKSYVENFIKKHKSLCKSLFENYIHNINISVKK